MFIKTFVLIYFAQDIFQLVSFQIDLYPGGENRNCMGELKSSANLNNSQAFSCMPTIDSVDLIMTIKGFHLEFTFLNL